MYNWDEDRGAGEHPNSFFFYLARLCNHCDKPACLEACPRDAIYKRDEDGIVLINEDKCEGYRFCLEACPYKVIYFNPQENVAQKCIGCYPRVEVGVAPACARHCPARARFYGYVDDPESTVYKLREWKVALPLQPKFGTGPNVFYIPVLSSSRLDDAGRPTGEPRIPLDYLKSLFGDDVEGALNTLREERQKMRNGGSSPLMDILIGWRWPDDFFAPFVKAPDEAKSPRKEVTGEAAAG
jgi:ethylbenzene hydroxylase subunit beta/complex iron-sulfur molybdoenzyme family reductase subunit beta